MLKFKEIIGIKNGEQENKKNFVSSIINSSAPKTDFYLMVCLSTLITALGLVSNNIALVIAGMIVAPLLSPILAMSLGTIIFNFKVFLRSIKIFILATLFSIIFSTLIGFIFNINSLDIMLIRKMEISWLSFTISIIAGITASYAWTRPNSKDYLSGIAIAVTIIPPLTSLGLILSNIEFELFIYILKFFLMNVWGIFLGGLLVFSFMNLYRVKKRIIKEVNREEKELQ
ncbi:MAG: TIGR00341 family protein [Patescibacteria group bacterium]|nr:TIGR00341 family protein [Patescibacteria group bacterium]